MKNIKYLTLSLFLILSVGCEELVEGINDNPNEISSDSFEAGILLLKAVSQAAVGGFHFPHQAGDVVLHTTAGVDTYGGNAAKTETQLAVGVAVGRRIRIPPGHTILRIVQRNRPRTAAIHQHITA